MIWRVVAKGLLVVGTFLGFVNAKAVDEGLLPVHLQRQWSAWLLEAYERPDVTLARLRAESAPSDVRHWQHYAEAYMLLQRGDDQALRDMIPAAAEGPTAWLVRALLAERDGQHADALTLTRRVLAATEPQCQAPFAKGEPAAQCVPWFLSEATLLHARLQVERGQLSDARARLAATALVLRAARDVDREALVLAESARAAQAAEAPQEADALLVQAMALSGLTGSARARVLNMQAVLASMRGQAELQGRLLKQAIDIAERSQAQRLAAALMGNLADFHLRQGQPREARLLVQAALPVLVRYREPMAERTARHNLTLAFIGERNFAGAREQLSRLETMTPDTPSRQAEALRELGQAWGRAGQAKEALALYHAERKLTAAIQAQVRDAALAEVRQRLGSAAQEAEVSVLQREAAVQAQTLGNQASLVWVGVAAAVLVGLSLSVGAVLFNRNRKAHQALRRNQQSLQTMSQRDPMTQLANRRQFHDIMAQRGAEPLEGTLVLIDIDHFKRVNDEHGHAAGDAVIKAYAQRLQSAVRATDLVVRWGGEEFLVYAPDLRALHAKAWVQRVMPTLSSVPLTLPDGLGLDVTCSMGFLTLPLPPLGVRFGWERAVHWADLALYAAKNRGRRRALGLVGVHVQDDISLAQVEADFEGAASAARLSLVQVLATA